MPPHSTDASDADSDLLTHASEFGSAATDGPENEPDASARVRSSTRGESGRLDDVRDHAGSDKRSARRADWRLGGRTTARWRERVLGVSLLSLGIGVLGGSAITLLVTAGWAAFAGTALLWVAMAGPVVWAFMRSRPVGLLSFRAQDLLFGIVLGAALRAMQGWVDVATGGTGAFPSYPTIGGAPPEGWVFDWVIAPVFIAPLIEEFFFRAVILVTVYTVLRRAFGKLAAGFVAAVVSTGLFVLVHGLIGTLAVDDVISLSALGAVCSLLVMLTGRIWPAVIVHVVYNGSYAMLALVGTFFG